MPRRPRIHLDGVLLHIVHRGPNREPCFFSEKNYSAYRHWLTEALADTECALHAYVLMTNHVHLPVARCKEHAALDVVSTRQGKLGL
jgi:putative transposase